MDRVEKYYGKTIFTLYALFMTVPGSNARYRKIFVLSSILMLSFSTVFQVMKFVSDGFTLKLMVELVPTIGAISATLVYILYLTFSTEIQNDLKEERTAEEDATKMQFASRTRLFTNTYTGVLLVTVCGVPVAGFLPYFYDVLMSVNGTRRAELLFDGEIFLDSQRYYYYIYFTECGTAAVAGILAVISENIAIVIGQHACGMLAVLGFLSTTAEFYGIQATIILCTSFCTLTMSLVQVTDPELINMKIVCLTCIQFCQLFLMSYIGQLLIDATLRVAENAYNAKWNNFPGKMRKLLQMVILRSSKPCAVLASSIYVLSVENCMSVVQTIVSFYMVLRKAN